MEFFDIRCVDVWGIRIICEPASHARRASSVWQCLAAHLGMKDVQGLIDMLENYMLNHRLVPVKNIIFCSCCHCFCTNKNIFNALNSGVKTLTVIKRKDLKTIRFHRSCR